MVSHSIWMLREKTIPTMTIMNFMNPAVGTAPCNYELKMNYRTSTSMKSLKKERK